MGRSRLQGIGLGINPLGPQALGWRKPGMWKTIIPMIVWSLLVVCVAGGATSQTLNRVVLYNRSHYSVHIIAYDPTCRIRVYQGLLAEGSSIVVRVCAGNRQVGSLIVYDVHGRKLKFSKLLDGSQVSVRFRNLSNR